MKSVLALLISACLSFYACCSLAAKSFKPLQWTTSNGARVVFYQAMDVPMLDITIAFAAGSAYDGQAFGLSALTTRLLNQGNKGLDASSIADRLAETGAQFGSESNKDMAVLSLKTLTTPEALNKATEVLSLIATHPDFPNNAFAREKEQQIMAIAQSQESPDEVAKIAFFKTLYQSHPYAHPSLGDKESVTALTNEQVQHFYQQYFVAKNSIIILVGAIDELYAKKIAEKLTHDLAPGIKAAAIPKASALHEEMTIEIPFPASQSVLNIGQLGIDHHDKRYFPLIVGNYILGGGGLVSQLALEVREKRGLTYGVYSQFLPMPGIGPFLINLSTKRSEVATAINVTRETLNAYLKNGPTENELIAAKRYLTGSFPLTLASNQSIAEMLLKIAFYQLADDFLDTYIAKVNAVSSLDIKQAFEQIVHPDKLLQVTVGKP